MTCHAYISQINGVRYLLGQGKKNKLVQIGRQANGLMLSLNAGCRMLGGREDILSSPYSLKINISISIFVMY